MTYPMGYNGPRRKHPDEETNPPPWNDTPTLPKGFVATSEKKVIKLPKEILNPTLTREDIQKMWMNLFLENAPSNEFRIHLTEMFKEMKKNESGVEEVHPNRVIRWLKKHF